MGVLLREKKEKPEVEIFRWLITVEERSEGLEEDAR